MLIPVCPVCGCYFTPALVPSFFPYCSQSCQNNGADKLAELEDYKEHRFKALAIVGISGEPVVGSYWQHYKGGFYQVTGRSIAEDTRIPLVHYQSLLTGFQLTRTLDNFCGIVAPEDLQARGCVHDPAYPVRRFIKHIPVYTMPKRE